jgi:hypothetical protein
MLVGILILMLAGGGVFAAAQGVFGAVAKADVAKVKASLLAELTKIETSAKAEEVAVVAKIKALLAKL